MNQEEKLIKLWAITGQKANYRAFSVILYMQKPKEY